MISQILLHPASAGWLLELTEGRKDRNNGYDAQDNKGNEPD